ncbi:glycosyltransferase family 39 protein [Acidipila sp. EB88]|uniref:ArnT family glycosyltransferase n=1 Tax=Acidipila sp. EB88 TaxID=2305226 RepID=UPI0013154212|nr:glycosyltransferase family 39 protein [Acidipila sp. EB88]
MQPLLSGKLSEHESSSRWTAGSILPLLFFFAVLKMLAQAALTALSVHAGYGIYRDELYYLECAHRLAAGYVDQPPLVALQALAAEHLFGYKHLVLFRLLPGFAGALTIMLTGLIARALGGTPAAAALAMLGVLTAPVFLATQSFVSMNAWDPVFWMAAVLAVLRLLAVPDAMPWWLLLGCSAGLGLENKASALFLIAALLMALAATPARHLLRRRGFFVAVGVTLLLALPNLWWQVVHHFPTYEWLKDVQHSSKDAVLPPWQFASAQVMMLSPFHLALWLPGVAWLLAGRTARPWRVAGVLYVVFLAIMFVLHAKDYYLAPIYPLCFAAGAVFWAEWVAGSSVARLALGAYAALLLVTVPLTVPFAVPVLSPGYYVQFTRIMHFAPIESEQHAPTPLPEFFADQLGWQALVDDVSRVYHALPPAEQQQTGILTGNYGQASAIAILGPPLGLPPVISGHQNFWLWGPGQYTGKEMIVVTTMPPAAMQLRYRSCTVAERLTGPYAMPWEQGYIYVCHERFQSFQTHWAASKLYF